MSPNGILRKLRNFDLRPSKLLRPAAQGARWYHRVNKKIAVAGGIVLLLGAVGALSNNRLAPIKPTFQSAAQEALRTKQCTEIRLLNQSRLSGWVIRSYRRCP